jgi:hypothetical protein
MKYFALCHRTFSALTGAGLFVSGLSVLFGTIARGRLVVSFPLQGFQQTKVKGVFRAPRISAEFEANLLNRGWIKRYRRRCFNVRFGSGISRISAESQRLGGPLRGAFGGCPPPPLPGAAV